MRVLAAHPFPDRYGADLMLLGALRALRSAGATVDVVVPEDGPLVPELLAADLSVTTTPFPVLRKALLRPAGLARLGLSAPGVLLGLARRIRRSRADVVYVNTLTLPHWLAAARLAGRPVVCHVREAEEQAHPVLQRGLVAPLLACQRIITNSAHTAHHLGRHVPRLADRIEVVHNGFVFGPMPEPRPPRPDGELLVVGRLSPRKGPHVAVRAVAALHARGLPLTLRLVGTAFHGYEWYVDELRRTVTDLGLDDHVSLDGYRTDVGSCNAAADVVLIPSMGESFGNVAVEALAAGRPLVASAVGGLRDIVDDGRTGVLVPPDDPTALADAVEELLASPQDAAAMGARGATDVRARYGMERYEQEIVRVIGATASAGRPRPGR